MTVTKAAFVRWPSAAATDVQAAVLDGQNVRAFA